MLARLLIGSLFRREDIAIENRACYDYFCRYDQIGFLVSYQEVAGWRLTGGS
ncbi:MAG: hypothetical protein ACQEXQ_19930 [Bacillota bacterium]